MVSSRFVDKYADPTDALSVSNNHTFGGFWTTLIHVYQAESVRGRFYPSCGFVPRTLAVDVFDDATRLYPVVESIFTDMGTQPKIHDYEIVIFEEDKVHRFDIFFKNHLYLPRNRTITTADWRGDIFIMRRAQSGHKHYVNVRSDDATRIDWAVMR